MPAWLIYSVAISAIVVLYWISAAGSIRLIDSSFLNKNPQWLADNPAFKARYMDSRYATRGFYFAGMAWLAVLGYLSAASSIEAVVVASVAATFLWVAMLFGHACLEYHRTWKKIPLPAKRQVTLERRALRDFVPPAWTYACYSLYALGVGIYVAAMVRGLISIPVFVGRMAGLAIVLVVGTLTLLYCVRRKRQPIDDAWPAYRKMEVRGNVVVLYACLLVLVWRILQDLFSISLFDDLAFFTTVSALIQLSWPAFLRSRPVKQVSAA